ncbi:MAG: hypothetical protein JHC95_02275 [Solirubrobacteraceae bacterium]|nr:hypothetical protein [Solirubrobacteraceae bacterium]
MRTVVPSFDAVVAHRPRGSRRSRCRGRFEHGPRLSIRRGVKVLVLFVIAALTFPVATSAAELRPDTDAPRGTADPLWLPSEEWVMERWMPFDEDRLYQRLGMPRSQVYWYLKAGHGTLLDLARAQGVTLTSAYLLGNRRKRTSPRMYAVLRARTRRILTQRHLAEHVLGHPWHRWSVIRHRHEIFGSNYPTLAAEGLPFEQMFPRSGVPTSALRERMLTRLAAANTRGVRQGATTARQVAIVERQDSLQIEATLRGEIALLCDLGSPR